MPKQNILTRSKRKKALALFQANRLVEARGLFEEICAADRSDAEAWLSLGVICSMLGELPQGEAHCRRAVTLRPDYAHAHYNLANILAAQTRPAEALARYDQVLLVNPDHVQAHNNRGNALASLGRTDEAIAAYKHAMALQPDYAEAHYNLGRLLAHNQHHAEAAKQYRAALMAHADFHSARHGLGAALRALGQHEEATHVYGTILRMQPDYIKGYFLLAETLADLGRFAEAEESLRLGLAKSPGNLDGMNDLGLVLHAQGKLDQALECFDEILRQHPDYLPALNNSARVLSDSGRWTEATMRVRSFLAHNPQFGPAHHLLGSALVHLGRGEEGINHLRQAVALTPRDASGYSGLLLALHYSAIITCEQLYADHRYWGMTFTPPAPAPVFAQTHNPGRRLKISYLSPDFRDHSVAYFIEPVLKHHDPQAIEVFCYSEAPVRNQDAVTARLKTYATHWLDTFGLSDETLAARIREDRIDILIDLAGHTLGNRLLALAYRPAPVQVTYLGYPNTTGLPAIDYRLTDEWADSPGQEAFHTEKLVRLSSGFLCYEPTAHAPPVSPSPYEQEGYITFGSFNALPKVNERVVACWARILKALPRSRLLLKERPFKDPAVQEEFAGRFAREGIERDRLELVGWLDRPEEHLGLYSRVDLALDTFPYNGATTTCEALRMGVPVVTLAGDRHAGRVGVSLLTRLGLPELIAQDEDDYLRLAVALAEDPARLKGLRQGLRERMRASSLCDAKGFTRQLEAAYRDMWREWCGGGQ